MKSEGVVLIGWLPLVKVIPQSDGTTLLEWPDPLVEKIKLDKEAVAAEFDAASSAQAGGAGLRARIAQTEWRP